jgi:hypothetical protein
MRAHQVNEMGKMDIGKIGVAKAVTSQPTSQLRMFSKALFPPFLTVGK